MIAWRQIRTILTISLLLAGMTAATYPFSETMIGGNYNLRYLSSNVRRMMRPLMSPPASFEVNRPDIDLTKHLLVSGLAISIYVPMAGFLWTDSLICDMSLGGWDENTAVRSRNHQLRMADHGHLPDPHVSKPAIRAHSRNTSSSDETRESVWHNVYSSDYNRVVFQDVIGRVGGYCPRLFALNTNQLMDFRTLDPTKSHSTGQFKYCYHR
jgi:hypothetical protein